MHILIVITLLALSNLIMTFAWYWHIKPAAAPLPLWQIILISWGIALLEYCLVVPANHFGAQWGIKPFQLKIMQEVVTLCIFALLCRCNAKAACTPIHTPAAQFLCKNMLQYVVLRSCCLHLSENH